MKIFGWAADNAACGYYRLRVPLDELSRRGHETLVHIAMPQTWRETADIIVGQRVCLPRPTVRWQKLAKEGRIALVYDIDDDLFHIDPGNRAGDLFNQPIIRDNIQRNIEVAHMVTVSTPELGETLKHLNPNIVVLPNSLDASLVAQIDQSTRQEGPGILLGWGGSATHSIDWLQVQAPLVEVMRRHPHARFRFLGTAYPDDLPRKRVEMVEWTEDFAVHYHNVSQFEIGIAPLADTRFNDAKSELKALEYAALGVPTIASASPAYRRFIVHDETGLLVEQPSQWRSHLTGLIRDPELRTHLRIMARKRAEEWMIQQRWQLWEDAYHALVRG